MEEEKKSYKKPETKEEARAVLENIPAKIYNRLKGRVLAALESIYLTDPEKEKQNSKFVTFKNAINLHLGTVTRGIKNEITDCLEILE